MTLEVRLFAVVRDLAGRPLIRVDLPEPATVSALRLALASAIPGLAPLLPKILIAVNSEYAPDDLELSPGADVAAIPPVSGGSLG